MAEATAFYAPAVQPDHPVSLRGWPLRRRFPRFTPALLLAVAAGLHTPPAAEAQTGTALLTSYWEPNQVLAGQADTTFVPTETRGPGEATDTNIWASRTRLRARVGSDGSPGEGAAGGFLFGHEYTHVDFSGGGENVPERLVRQEMDLGFTLDEQAFVVEGDGWFSGLWTPAFEVGFGHASTNPYADDRGWYGLASVQAERVSADGTRLLLGLTYDGNRSTLPDLPLPLVLLRKPLSIDPVTGKPSTAEIGLTLGYPETRLIYKPDDSWTLSAGFSQLDAFTALASYRVSDQLTVLAGYGGFYDQFHDADTKERRRIFVVGQRLEVGATVTPIEDLSFTLTGGWGFGQQLRRGYDLRSTEEIQEFDDAPFVRLAARFSF